MIAKAQAHKVVTGGTVLHWNARITRQSDDPQYVQDWICDHKHQTRTSAQICLREQLRTQLLHKPEEAA